MHNFSYKYRCVCGNKYEKNGSWETIRSGDETEDILIVGNGRKFKAILGYSGDGIFLCIPYSHVGCFIETTNTLVVIEHLAKVLGPEDAYLIAYALEDRFKKPSDRVYK